MYMYNFAFFSLLLPAKLVLSGLDTPCFALVSVTQLVPYCLEFWVNTLDEYRCFYSEHCWISEPSVWWNFGWWRIMRHLCSFLSYLLCGVFVTPYGWRRVKVNIFFRSWRGVLDSTLCDKVCQWLATGRWFSPGPPVSEILLKVTLYTINKQTSQNGIWHIICMCFLPRIFLYIRIMLRAQLGEKKGNSISNIVNIEELFYYLARQQMQKHAMRFKTKQKTSSCSLIRYKIRR